ncbi:hypothetical protein [Sphingomonas hengshuiensis]|uniref:hypothetical protein n=1 Tax=Sphingomonas hengshuiensis TaxID=1609977 RepID=UPI0012BA2145|nr:hypothetical protein [Sphingomonas hengshuiensis]
MDRFRKRFVASGQSALGCGLLFVLVVGFITVLDTARDLIEGLTYGRQFISAIPLLFAAAILAAIHWAISASRDPYVWAVVVIDCVLVIGAVHSGNYWAVFPRGEGYFTLNRATAYGFLLAAIFVPNGIRALHWRFVERRRLEAEWRARHDPRL